MPIDLNALANGPMVRWGQGNPSLPKPRATQPRGHAAPPGGGPAGETCKTCLHIYRKRECAKAYIKCGLAKAKWTGGTGSDIRARDPACALWARTYNDERMRHGE